MTQNEIIEIEPSFSMIESIITNFNFDLYSTELYKKAKENNRFDILLKDVVISGISSEKFSTSLTQKIIIEIRGVNEI